MENQNSNSVDTLEQTTIDIPSFFAVVDVYVRANIQENGWELLESNSVEKIIQEKTLHYTVKINDSIGNMHFFYRLENYASKNPFAAWQLFRKELRTDFGIVSLMANNPDLYNFVQKYTGLATSVSKDTFGSPKQYQLKLSGFWDVTEQIFNPDKYYNALWEVASYLDRMYLYNDYGLNKLINLGGSILSTGLALTGGSITSLAGISTAAVALTPLQIKWFRNYTLGGHTRLLDDMPNDLDTDITNRLMRSTVLLKEKLLNNLLNGISTSSSSLTYNNVVVEDKLLEIFIDYLNTLYNEKFSSQNTAIPIEWLTIHNKIKDQMLHGKDAWKLKLYSHILNLKGEYEGMDFEGAVFWKNALALAYSMMLVAIGLDDKLKSQSISAQIHEFMNREKFKSDLLNLVVQLLIASITETIKDELGLDDAIKETLNNCNKHEFTHYTKAVLETLSSHDGLNNLVEFLYRIYEEDGCLHLLAGYERRLNRKSTGEIEFYQANRGSHAIFVVLNKENKDVMIFNCGGGYTDYHQSFKVTEDSNGVYPYLLTIPEQDEEINVKAYIKRILISSLLPKTIYFENDKPIELALPMLYNTTPNSQNKVVSHETFLLTLKQRSTAYLESYFKFPMVHQVVGNCTYASIEHYLLVALPSHQSQYGILLNCIHEVVKRWESLKIDNLTNFTTVIKELGGSRSNTKITSTTTNQPLLQANHLAEFSLEYFGNYPLFNNSITRTNTSNSEELLVDGRQNNYNLSLE